MKKTQIKKIRRNLFGNTTGMMIALGIIAVISFVAGGCSLEALFGSLSLCAVAGVVLPEAEFQTKVLGCTDALTAKIAELETAQKTHGDDGVKMKEAINGVSVALEQFRKEQQSLKRSLSRGAARRGDVSEECARHLTAIALSIGLVQQKFIDVRQAETAENIVKSILGNSFDNKFRTALSASDIPLPVDYSGDVVELVSQYSAARKYGTVFPLGTGVVKLPRLKTDTAFGLLAQSTAITQVSPQTEWVTFTAEKFGGLILLPTEIDEDSIVAMGQFLARYSARNIAKVEDHNFFVGTGAASGANGTVAGLCATTITNSKVKQMGSGLASPSEISLAHLRSIRSVVAAPAIGMGAYYMHPTLEQHLSGLNTAGDKPYTANGANGASLDGFPIRWVDIMPAYTTADVASTVHVLFGDLSYQYLGVRGGMRFQSSTEAGFATDDIYVRALERFTIGLMSTSAVSGLQTAA
jgi:HK97 family phage major capsid protein